MKDSQILSTFTERTLPRARAKAAPVLVFDACQVGVILRAVLYVEVVVAVGLMYVASGVSDWVSRVALITGGALPATLLWLVAGCSLKRPLARLPWALQMGAGVVLGALAGLYACGTLALLGMTGASPPWLASACTSAPTPCPSCPMAHAQGQGKEPWCRNCPWCELVASTGNCSRARSCGWADSTRCRPKCAPIPARNTF